MAVQQSVMNAEKDFNSFFSGEPPGQRTNAIRWLQKRVMEQSLKLPREFETLAAWESYKRHIRAELPGVIGIPELPPLKNSVVRGRVRVGEDIVCERIDVYFDDDYAIPAFVFSPAHPPAAPMPALLWNPGWPEEKFKGVYQEFAVRMARQGFVVLIPDHAPFGETTASFYEIQISFNMTLTMGAGDILGISQLALRSAETMRCGEYLRSRADVDPNRVAISGLCQGGQDTWLAAALDDGFCAAAPFCSATTYTVHIAEMGSYHANSDSSPYPFGILKVCDIEHLHAAIAPRPLMVRNNLPDRWWPVSGFNDVETLTRKVYRLYDAEDRIEFSTEVHEHNLTGIFADQLEQFLRENVL